jgi:hypothetical protein
VADVVCLVQSGADRVSFRWSQGPDAFDPYHLTGHQFVIFGTQVEELRKRLSAVVTSYLDYLHQPQAEAVAADLARACLALAQAGSELRKRIFKPSEGERVARDVAKWLEKLHAQKAVESLEVVTEGWLPVPWNLLYDRPLVAGRDGDVIRVARMLGDADTRRLVLRGESGCGKSSFLQAGLLPYLEEECVGYCCLRDRTQEGEGRLKFVRATGDLAGQLAQALCEFCARPWQGKTPAGKALRVDLPQVTARLLAGPITK